MAGPYSLGHCSLGHYSLAGLYFLSVASYVTTNQISKGLPSFPTWQDYYSPTHLASTSQ